MKCWKAARCLSGVLLVVVSFLLIVIAMLAVFLDVQRNSVGDWLIFGFAMFLFFVALVLLATFTCSVQKVNAEEKAMKLMKKAMEERNNLQIATETSNLRTMREPSDPVFNRNSIASNKNAPVSKKPYPSSKRGSDMFADFNAASSEPPPILSQNQEELEIEMMPQQLKRSEFGSRSKKRESEAEGKRSRSNENCEVVYPLSNGSEVGDWDRMPAGEQSLDQVVACQSSTMFSSWKYVYKGHISQDNNSKFSHM